MILVCKGCRRDSRDDSPSPENYDLKQHSPVAGYPREEGCTHSDHPGPREKGLSGQTQVGSSHLT